jgi:hypothetical protein
MLWPSCTIFPSFIGSFGRPVARLLALVRDNDSGNNEVAETYSTVGPKPTPGVAYLEILGGEATSCVGASAITTTRGSRPSATNSVKLNMVAFVFGPLPRVNFFPFLQAQGDRHRLA